jgi:hypothetical protein
MRFHVIDYLPRGNLYDITYFIYNILASIKKIIGVHAAAHQKRVFVIHVHNSLIHRPEAMVAKIASLKVRIALCSANAPDIAPLDFLFF